MLLLLLVVVWMVVIFIDIADDLFPKQDGVGRGRWGVLYNVEFWLLMLLLLIDFILVILFVMLLILLLMIYFPSKTE